MRQLNDRQRRFAKEYLLDLNATQAAIRAGYSKKTAHQIGFRLLKNVDIQELVSKGVQKTSEKLDISVERIMAEYAKLGFSDIADYGEWDEDGNSTLRSSKELGDKTAAIQEITVNHTTTDEGETQRLIKFKLHPKIQALDALCKMQGLFVERRELSGPGGGPIAVKRAADLDDDELAAIAAAD